MKMKDANLAEWSVGDLKSVLTELKLKTTRGKKELLDRLLPFTRSDNNLLEKRLKRGKEDLCFSNKYGPNRNTSSIVCMECGPIAFSESGRDNHKSIHWIQETRPQRTILQGPETLQLEEDKDSQSS